MKCLYKEYCLSQSYQLIYSLKPIRKIVDSYLKSKSSNFFKKEFIKNKNYNYSHAYINSKTGYLIRVNHTCIWSIFRSIKDYKIIKKYYHETSN